MGRKSKYSTGHRKGLLTVIEYVGELKGKPHYRCQCDCGNKIVIQTSRMTDDLNVSCGCWKKDLCGKNSETHGHAKHGKEHPLYQTWSGMRERCTSPRATGYRHYGGRGIKVCERWMDFENFIIDMGEKPTPQHSLDRIDNESHYEPSNCRWATKQEQNRNRRSSSLEGKINMAVNFLRENAPEFLTKEAYNVLSKP